jgi:hypothetical protein
MMATGLNTYIDRLVNNRALRLWRRAAEAAPSLDLDTLRGQRGRARTLRRQLDRFLHLADGRLALPLIESNAILTPPGADWAWRPAPWRGPLAAPGLAAAQSGAAIGEGATLFHDCQYSELTLRQIRNTRQDDLAPFGLRLDVFRFDGSFLSVVLDLPQEAATTLRRRHLVRVDLSVTAEAPLEIFARLNVLHGPNTDQMVREFPMGQQGELMVEFDLAYGKINEKRIEKVWIDLILEGPQMNQITLHDLTLSRRPRADI